MRESECQVLSKGHSVSVIDGKKIGDEGIYLCTSLLSTSYLLVMLVYAISGVFTCVDDPPE